MSLSQREQNDYQQAMQAVQQGQFETALSYCEQILAQQPRHLPTLQLRGVCALRLGYLEKAYQAFKVACEMEPRRAIYWVNLGEACWRLGMQDQAIQQVEKAIQIEPQFGGAYYNLANMRKQKGELEPALKAYQEALRLEPNNPQFSYNLANTLFELGFVDQAIRHYQLTLSLNPQYAQAHYNLGVVYQGQNRWDEAIQNLQIALQQKPDWEEARQVLALTYEAQGRLDESRQILRERVKLESDNWALRLHFRTLHPLVNLTTYEVKQYRQNLPEVLAYFRQADFFIQGNEIHEQIHPSTTLIYQGQSNKDLLMQYAELFSTSFKKYRQVKTRPLPARPHIGFVITRGHLGIFAKFMKNILNRLPSHRYRLSLVCDAGEYQTYLASCLEHPAIQLIHLPQYFEAAAEVMAAAEFDLLYHWEVGSDAMNYFLPFLNLAPIQCTSLGWPQTTGIPEMDYFISSQKLEIHGAQSHYSEKLHLFADLPFNYDWPEFPQKRIPMDDLGLDPGRNHYLCVQNLRKLHPDFDRLIAEILRRDPQGQVSFVAHASQYITERIKTRIQVVYPDIADRVIFLPRLSWAAYLSLIKQVNVLLDTLYYGGANTSLEALAAGTPVVTLPWSLERGRYTQACYRLLDLAEPVADSEEDYIQRALRIGTDPDYQRHLRHQILGRNGVLFNQSVVQNYLEFFEMVFEKER